MIQELLKLKYQIYKNMNKTKNFDEDPKINFS